MPCGKAKSGLCPGISAQAGTNCPDTRHRCNTMYVVPNITYFSVKLSRRHHVCVMWSNSLEHGIAILYTVIEKIVEKIHRYPVLSMPCCTDCAQLTEIVNLFENELFAKKKTSTLICVSFATFTPCFLTSPNALICFFQKMFSAFSHFMFGSVGKASALGTYKASISLGYISCIRCPNSFTS